MVDLLCTTLRTDASGALDTNVTADDIALEVTGNRSAMHLSPQEVSTCLQARLWQGDSFLLGRS